MKPTEKIFENTSNNRKKMAVITGATSGIGKSFAYQLANKGYNLILTGRKQGILKEISDNLRKNFNINVNEICADLGKSEELQFLMEFINKQDRIDILINNAGYGLSELFHEDIIENQLKMIQVQVVSPILLIHQVLPKMINQKNGIIINVSSLAAFIPTSDNAMYTSTKSFLKNFTISLNMELKQHGIYAQCLCPGFTHTEFHKKLGIQNEDADLKKIGWMTSNDVVKYSLKSIEHHTVLCVPGTLNKLVMLIALISPPKWIDKISELMSPKHKHNIENNIQLNYFVNI